jgi:hypothetical protein
VLFYGLYSRYSFFLKLDFNVLEYIPFSYVRSLKKINVFFNYKHSNVLTFYQYGHCLF